MAVSHPPAEEVADTLAKGSSDDGAESRYLDEFPPDTPVPIHPHSTSLSPTLSQPLSPKREDEEELVIPVVS